MAQLTACLLFVKNRWFLLQFRNRVNQIDWRNKWCWDAELIVAAVLIHCFPQFYAILPWELSLLLLQMSHVFKFKLHIVSCKKKSWLVVKLLCEVLLGEVQQLESSTLHLAWDLMPKTRHHHPPRGHPFASCFDFVTSSSAASTALACCVQRWTTSQVPLTYSGSANGVKQKWSGFVTKETWQNKHATNMYTQN